MRRFLSLLLMSIILTASVACAQGMPWDAILSAVEKLNPNGLEQEATFHEAGGWISAIVSQKGQIAPQMEGRQWYGLVFDMATGEPITWEDVFVDGDAAADRIQALAEASTYDNAYAEYNQIAPVPRDSFVVRDGVFTVYYPAEQLSSFSGQSGAFTFYAYELEELLKGGVPLAQGDSSQAAVALETVLSEGAFPAPLSDWKLGGSMAEAAEALGLVDVPDLTYDAAVYRFEASEMRGITLLASPGDEDADRAVIVGMMAERMDFSGLRTGVSSREECVAALGEPDSVEAVETSDAYSRLPIGETLRWVRGDKAFELHFADGILYSVALWMV